MIKIIKELNKGFTMIEMLMVIAIFSILTSVIIFNYSDFNNNIIATNMAYEVAMTVREAQVYSLGVKTSGGDNDFNHRYGVYFNTSNSYGNQNFLLFYDSDDSMACNQTGSLCTLTGCTNTECRQMSSMTRGIKIASLCVSTGEPLDASGHCLGTTVKDLSITFLRPDPDAEMCTTEISGSCVPGHDIITDAAIIIEAPNSSRRAVVVRSTGQISVETYPD